MKILIIFWDLGIGGIQSIIRDFILYILSEYPNVSVVLLVKNNKPSHILDSLHKNGFFQVYSPPLSIMKRNRYTRHISFFIWIAYKYILIQPDICLTFLDSLSFFMVLLRKIVFWKQTRIVLNENILTSKNIELNKRPVWLWNFITRLLYPLADMIIAPSQASKLDLIQKYYIDERIISVCVNWTITKKIQTIKKTYDLAYVGRLEKEKNPFDLIRLTVLLRKTIPRISLCVIGTGSYESEMKSQVKSLHLEKNIFFLGYRSDISRLLSQSKILVTTTINEGLPIAVLEAGIQSIPCVSTRFLGSDEVILHNTSGVITDSLKDMSAAILNLLQQPSVLEEFGKNSYTHVSLNFAKNSVGNYARTVLGI